MRSNAPTPSLWSVVPICTILAPHRGYVQRHRDQSRRPQSPQSEFLDSDVGKSMDIGKSRWFDVFSTNPTKAVLRTNHHRLILDVEAISDRIDAVDKLERVFVKDRCRLIKMNDIKIRWQLDP